MWNLTWEEAWFPILYALLQGGVAGYFIKPLGRQFGKLDRPTQSVFITNPNYGQKIKGCKGNGI
tara:strand:- start:844 stop:1035 length:192 start_codon:yes stop_codon:yes gene_type:complete